MRLRNNVGYTRYFLANAARNSRKQEAKQRGHPLVSVERTRPQVDHANQAARGESEREHRKERPRIRNSY